MKYLLLVFSLAMAARAAAQNCELIAKYGVYDTRTTDFSRERAISYLNLFKRDINMTYQDAKNYSATIGVPIDGVLVELGLDANEQSYKKFIEAVLNMTTYDEVFIEKVITVSKTVNKDIIQILAQCYQQDGIHARIESTEDDNTYYLIVYYKKTGNSPGVKLRLSWNARKEDMTLNGMQYNKKYDFTIKADQVMRFVISRNGNVTIPFVLNMNGGETVTIHSGNLAIYKIKPVPPTPASTLKLQEIQPQVLARTPMAAHVGDGDEELKRFPTTHVFGSFTLGLENETTLVGNLSATIKEEQSDWTEFRLSGKYTLFSAPEGYRIVGFKISDGSAYTSNFDKRQSDWVMTEHVSDGPLDAFEWAGDTGRNQDQIEGCWIKPHLKAIKVIMEKK